MKPIYIKDECWDTELWVLCPAQNQEINRFLKSKFKLGGIPDDGEFTGRFIEILGKDESETGGLIALKRWTGSPRDYATLAHECLHAAHWFLNNRGVKFGFKTDESFCYLMDSFVRRAAEQLQKGAR
jgi:hypothetical protein